jgi:hypothetical protein
MAIFGWTNMKLAALYTRQANRAKLEVGAAHKLNRAEPNPAQGGNKRRRAFWQNRPGFSGGSKIRAY